MFRNRKDREISFPVIKLFSLSAIFLLQSSCGGGEGKGDNEASALGIEDVAIAYVKRPTPRDADGVMTTHDMREPLTFNEGGDLYVQARATVTANSTNVTRRITNGLGDVKDVSASYDGNKLVFSLRLEDPDPNDNIIPRWYLYEYDIPSDALTQLTSSAINDGDDISPHYLPDGRIIFASTRQKASKAIRVDESRGAFTAVDENRNNPAFSLHVLDTIGDITQVSFNPSNDLDPIVLKDSGRVLFSRWNRMGTRNDVSLYTMNPDGTDVQMYYGAHSHNTGQDPNTAVHFYKPRQLEDGRILAILRPFVTNFGGGDIIVIDGKNFADNTQPIWSQQGYISGPAQTVLKQNVTSGTGLSFNGRYNATFPLLDGSNRYLMSWSQCQILEIPADPNSNIIPCTLATQAQLNDPNVQEASPSYGIFLVDPGAGTQVPLIRPEADTLFSEVVMAYATKTPPIIFPDSSPSFIGTFAAQGIGVLHIRSVYDFDGGFAAYGATLPVVDNETNPITIDTPAEIANPKNTTADQRPARFIRITKNVSFSNPLPDGDQLSNAAFGRSVQQGMREIVGYAPIEPDGSVKIKVPANVPLTLGILDKDGRRISDRHQSWFQVKPGETLECIGCHVHDTTDLTSNKPHGRPDYASTFNQAITGQYLNSVDYLLAIDGETMAETRSRINDCSPNPPPCDLMKPSTDLVYDDVWTDDMAANRSADDSFTIDYSGMTTDSPISSGSSVATACSNTLYDGTTQSLAYCRIVINYEQHIAPIWATTNNRPGSVSCVSCHTAANVESAGQLDLSATQSDIEPEHLTSYQELLNNDNAQNNAGNDLTITREIDPPIDADMDGFNDTETVPDPNLARTPTMSTAGAYASRTFMERMTGLDLDNDMGNQPADSVNHQLMLTPSELKLITEWLDIGAQYFNDPLDPAVPTN